MNTIDVLKENYKEVNGLVRAFTYSFLFVLDTADNNIFEARDAFKHKFPKLYKHEAKMYLNRAYDSVSRLISVVRPYTKDSWDDTIDNLDEYHERFKKEVFILYNVMLKRSSKYFFDDYEMAKIVVKLDLAHLILLYWKKMNSNVVSSMPYPLNKTTNDYDTLIDSCLTSIRRFTKVKGIVSDKEVVVEYTKEDEANYLGAFSNFRSALTKIFNELVGVE